jgi:multidrug resistance efflux pump
MAEHVQPIETPRAQRIENFRRRGLPVVVWSVAAALCALMMFNRAQQYEIIGIAQTMEYEVSSRVTGTLDTVLVDLYDEIDAGDLVAKLDDSQVLASIATIHARIEKLGDELSAARVDVQSDSADLTADLRRFQIDEEQRRLDALKLKVTIESDEIEAERLELQVTRNERLLQSGLISEMDFENSRLQYQRVRKQVDENRILLAETEEDYRTAKSRRETYERESPIRPGDEPLQPLRGAIAVESGQLREIELRREALYLRSPIAGQVSQLLCRHGQSVVPGEPIMMVAERATREILAFLPDGEEAQRDAAVLVSSRANPDRAVESRILRVGPTVQELPARLWRDSRTPAYGRSIVIAGVQGLKLVPGELVNVQLLTD